MIQWLANSSCNGRLRDLVLSSSQEGKTDRQQKITQSFKLCCKRDSRIQWLASGSGWSGAVQEEEPRHAADPGEPQDSGSPRQAGITNWPQPGLSWQQLGSLSPSIRAASACPQHAGARSARVPAQVHQHPFLHVSVTLAEERMKTCTCWNSLYCEFTASQKWP